jgi:DNA polymerase-4
MNSPIRWSTIPSTKHFFDLTGWYRDSAEAAWALAKVRARIRDEVGDWLRCSIGIAPTRFLAKTASDMEKPNGLVVIHQENLDEMLAKLDLEDVCGIGPRTRKRLNAMGIQTLLEIKRTPIGNLMRAFGKGWIIFVVQASRHGI